MKRKFLISILLLLTGSYLTLRAQNAVTEMKLSLKEAQDYAIQNNKMMISSRYDVDASRTAIWETISNLLPSISGSGSFVDNVKLGSIVVDINGQQVVFTMGQQFNTSASVSANLLVFNAPAIIGIQTAKLANKLSQNILVKSELDTRESVSSAYYNILVSEKSLDLLEGNIEILNNNLKATKSMLAVGMAEQTDVDQMASNVRMVENSRSALLRNIEINYNLLRFMLGVKPETNIQLSETLEGITSQINVETILSQEFDVRNNIDYKLVDGQAAMSSLMLKTQKASTLPTIAGYYSYNTNGMGSKIADQRWFESAALGFSLSVPIFASGQRYVRIKKAQIDFNKAVNTREMVTEQLLLQQKQLRYNLVNANQQYTTQKENVEISKRVYTSTENKYRQGMASSLDLTQANSLYLQAENNYISALMSLMQTKLALDKLLNNM
ncbi:MAG TPA: TolC family protein [Bacteroidales bacterium]|jgi:outer membrane protein TolC|nr:TolC family protein [Bacteroidales bacterium]